MPIEVRELVIKAVVSREDKSPARKQKPDPVSRKNIESGLEEVLRLIKNRNER